jgi:hypothetical protein
MSSTRAFQRTVLKKEFKDFVKKNPQFKTMTFNAFSKLWKQSAKFEKAKTKPLIATATASEGLDDHVHGPHCDHDHDKYDDVMADIMVDTTTVNGPVVEATVE